MRFVRITTFADITFKPFISKLALATNNADASPAMALRRARTEKIELPTSLATTRPMSTLPCYGRVLKSNLRAQRHCTICRHLCSYYCTVCTSEGAIAAVCNSNGRRPECYVAHAATRAHIGKS